MCIGCQNPCLVRRSYPRLSCTFTRFCIFTQYPLKVKLKKSPKLRPLFSPTSQSRQSQILAPCCGQTSFLFCTRQRRNMPAGGDKPAPKVRGFIYFRLQSFLLSIQLVFPQLLITHHVTSSQLHILSLQVGKSGKKICCSCPETKEPRDECIVANGEDKCKDLIEAHKVCLRKEGFTVAQDEMRYAECEYYYAQSLYIFFHSIDILDNPLQFDSLI